jgi:hypothetical protein
MWAKLESLADKEQAAFKTAHQQHNADRGANAALLACIIDISKERVSIKASTCELMEAKCQHIFELNT